VRLAPNLGLNYARLGYKNVFHKIIMPTLSRSRRQLCQLGGLKISGVGLFSRCVSRHQLKVNGQDIWLESTRING